MDAILRDRRAARPRGRRGQRARPLRQATAGRPLGTLRRAGDAELPRDQELHLRRGRRAAHQRPGAASSAPRSSARRAPTAAGSSAARSTSTPGSTSARATCRRTCSPRSSARSSRRARRIQAARHGRLEPATTRRWPTGPPASGVRPADGAGALRAIRRTCSTCCCRRSTPGTRLHRAPRASRGHPRGLPLPAAAPVADGPRIGGRRRRLPGHRGRGRPPGAPAALRRHEGGRTGLDRRSPCSPTGRANRPPSRPRAGGAGLTQCRDRTSRPRATALRAPRRPARPLPDGRWRRRRRVLRRVLGRLAAGRPVGCPTSPWCCSPTSRPR